MQKGLSRASDKPPVEVMCTELREDDSFEPVWRGGETSFMRKMILAEEIVALGAHFRVTSGQLMSKESIWSSSGWRRLSVVGQVSIPWCEVSSSSSHVWQSEGTWVLIQVFWAQSKGKTAEDEKVLIVLKG